MAGNRDGGIQAAQTNKTKHGEDFYKKIGALGGAKKVKKGFAANPDLARRAGILGGRNSTRAGIPNRKKDQ